MRRSGILFALFLLLLGACRGEGERPLTIGSKNFSEQVILGEIAAQGLEARGVRVDRRLNLGGTFVCHRALTAGEVGWSTLEDIVWMVVVGSAFYAVAILSMRRRLVK